MGSYGIAMPEIITFRIPRTSNEHLLRSLAEKYKTLRLTGLRLSPEAFSSTFTIESQYPDEVWMARLANAQLETFICAVAPSGYRPSSGEVDITDSKLEWIAQATLRGPLETTDFVLPSQSGHLAAGRGQERSQERWQFLALYTLPTFRGQGVAKKLCQATIAWLESDRLPHQSSIETIHVRTIIKRHNTASLTLFKKLGFFDNGSSTLAEALLANGESVPSEWDEDDERRHVRGGCILSLMINRGE